MQAQARLAIAPNQILHIGGGQVADGGETVRAQGAAEHRPDAGQGGHGSRRQQTLRLGDADNGEAAGLVQLRRDLCQEAVGRQADGDAEARLVLDPLLQTRQLEGGRASVQPLRALQVDPRLVQRQGLNQRRQAVDGAEDALALGHIFAEVRLDHHGVGAGLQRLEHRHGGADAIQPRHIAGGGDHPALAAADDDRPVAQFRSIAFLDRGVEGVAVQVGDVQIAQLVMGDDPARGARRTPPDLAVAGPQAVATEGRDGQARTPFVSASRQLKTAAVTVHPRRRNSPPQKRMNKRRNSRVADVQESPHRRG